MATNIYLNNRAATSEQGLVNDLTRETIQFHGIDVVYAPRTLVNEDELFGEDVLSKFTSSYHIEMYIDSIEGFQGDGDVISQFGFEIKDEVNMIVHKDRFKLVTGMDKPLEGDLIYYPTSNGLFEIKFVEHENPFYQQGKLYSYNLTCELFHYSHEILDTGIDQIDKVEDEFANLDSVANIPFADNTTIQTESDSVLDFSESNPFSEGNF